MLENEQVVDGSTTSVFNMYPSGIILFENTIIKLPCTQHRDILNDARLFVQLLVDGEVIEQTEPVGRERTQSLWKLKSRIQVPTRNPCFTIAVLCQSASQGVRLLGSVELTSEEIFGQPVEMTSQINRKLVKVDDDGASLEFVSGFSVLTPAFHQSSITSRISADNDAEVMGSADNKIIQFLPQMMAISQSRSLMEPDDLTYTWLLLHPDTNKKPTLLNMFGDVCSSVYLTTQNVDDLNRATSAYEDAVQLISDGDPRKAIYAGDLGTSLFHCFERLGNLPDIEKSISMREDAVRLTPDSHPHKTERLFNLSTSFFCRFKHLGELIDINKSILMFEDAVQLTPNSHPNKPAYLNNLGSSVLSRFEQYGELSDIKKSILILGEAVGLTLDSNLDKPMYLSNLGNSFLHHFELLGELSDIDKSVSMFEHALSLTPDEHPNKPVYLSNLSNSFLARFGQCGELTDIDKSISMREDVVRLTPDDHPDKPMYLSNLGNSFLVRFEQHGELIDIEKSIMMLKDAVQLTPNSHFEKPMMLSNLGTSFIRRFEHFGELNDIDKSISMIENALQLTPNDHPDKSMSMSNLGSSFLRRFERLGELIDIEKSILILEDAMQLIPDGHPDKPGHLSNLGHSLYIRFLHLGELIDIDKSILMFENALQLTPDGHPDKPMYLSNLGTSFFCRFEQLGVLIDVEKSISMLERAVQLSPRDHPNTPMFLSNLGDSFLNCFKRNGELIDIKKSILMKEDATQLTPEGHPDRPAYLNNLGNSVLSCFLHLGELIDMEKSISIFEDAVQLTPDDHPNKPAYLNNLGNAVLSRFQHHCELIDIEKSILMFESAVKLTPDSHPDKPMHLSNLGNSFLIRFEHLQDLPALNQAIVHFSSAACYSIGAPSIRFKASSEWARCAQILQHSSLLEAYTLALELLPQIAWLGLPIHDRHRELVNAGNVTSDAVATAIERGEHETAIEWLEQGRSIVWGQILQLRTPVDKLHEQHLELANQFAQVSHELEQAGAHHDYLQVANGNSYNSPEQVIQRHHKLTSEWKELVKRVQEVPGFERFLLPKKLPQLTPAAKSGPVVVLNISKIQCDALILVPDIDNVLHLPLSSFTFKRAQTLQSSLNSLLSHNDCISSGRPFKSVHIDSQTGDTNTEFEFILSELWLHVVKPVLDILGLTISSTSKLSRIWWCPTGPLTFLPLHAAGLYGPTSVPGSELSKFVVSSYTPTLSALMDKSQSYMPQMFQLLAVAQPNTYGQHRLPNTEKELNQIREHAGNFTVISLIDSDATVERVVTGMKESNWVHFACHGVQDTYNPTESGLLLADQSRLTLSEVIKMSLPHAGLAFLSACQTATGAEDLSEEAVHLAAGMLLAGYSGVIATMWLIMDRDASCISDNVYAHLFREQQPDHTQAAYALHYAIQQLRRSTQNISYFSWVPFIHIGA